MKWISCILITFFYTLSLAQGMTAFEKFVFRETTLNFSQKYKKLLVPTLEEPYGKCSAEEKPFRYECSGSGGSDSKTFITKGKKSDDFNVAIFHPAERSGDTIMSINSFIKDGKVEQQSRCFYDSLHVSERKAKNNHYMVTDLECYVITPKLCNILNEIKTAEDIKDISRFERFINVLKSREYKEASLAAQRYSYRQTFLKINIANNFDAYSKMTKGFYDVEKHSKVKSLKVVEFEKSLLVQQSKSIRDIALKAKTLFSRVFFKPCKNLVYNNLFADSKVEYVDKLDGANVIGATEQK